LDRCNPNPLFAAYGICGCGDVGGVYSVVGDV
jgi:hypothetical protein